MSRRDVVFAVGTTLLTLVVPGLMLVRPVFVEERYVLGTLCGWGLALAVMVPSYVLLARTLHGTDNQRFLRAFAYGTGLRMAGCLVGTLAFALLVEQAPKFTFLIAFFMGYVLLTALELRLTLRRAPTREERA
ncbi:MAG: hypothetical protein H6825_14460 [Planctomycetes bacterium]|nr:hypothetical protein [Planctomycetota bacterium]